MLDEKYAKRKKRVRILRRMIFTGLALAVGVPTVLCLCLWVQVAGLKKQVIALQEEQAVYAQSGQEAVKDVAERDSVEYPVEEEGWEEELTEADSIRAWEMSHANDGETEERGSSARIRKVYLTFDDGPSIYTNRILDILKEYDVKATFFVVAEHKEPFEDCYRRIVEEGHTLGLHSYSHKYSQIYRSRESFIRDVNQLQDYLYQVTGVHPQIYRFPGGSSNRASHVPIQVFKDYLEEIGLTYYDWNISCGDATGAHPGKDTIVWNSTSRLSRYTDAMILMHDSGDKRSTVEALPEIIEKILAMEDTVIVPVTEDTVPIQHS